jgi:undecaprenyl-diphosphatase
MAASHARRIGLRTAIACVALACVWLAMLIFGGGQMDRSIAQALYAGSNPALVVAARTFTALGEPTVLVAGGFLVAAALWWIGRGRFAIGLLVVILVGRALTEAQKYWIARARPEVEPHLVVVKTSSFPSGHSASSMIFYLVLALALAGRTRWRQAAAAGALLIALLTGLSRVMLGVHWPSDVIGGWSFGLLWVLLTLPTAERLFGGDSRTLPKRL